MDTSTTRTQPARRGTTLVLCPTCGDVFELTIGRRRRRFAGLLRRR